MTFNTAEQLPLLREPTADEWLGMAWWNALPDEDRLRWMQEAGGTGRVADAWAAFKHSIPAAPAAALRAKTKTPVAVLREWHAHALQQATHHLDWARRTQGYLEAAQAQNDERTIDFYKRGVREHAEKAAYWFARVAEREEDFALRGVAVTDD